MSDYLSNIIAKSLGLAEVLQPRRASLFEPQPDVRGMPPLDPPPEMETAQAQWSPDRSLTESHPPLSGLEPTPYASENQPDSDNDKSTARHAEMFQSHPAPDLVPPIISPSTPPQTASRTSGENARQQGLANTLVPAITEHKPESASSRNAGEQAAFIEAPQLKNIRRDVSASAQVTTSRTPVAVIAPRQETPVSESPRSKWPSAQPGQQASGSARQGIRPAEIKPAVRATTEPVATPEPLPTIRITIGRVDVRAILTAQPAPRPAPPPQHPRLSLDEYLKQRNGGQ